MSVTAGTTAGATIAYAAGTTTPTGLDLRIDGMYLTQSVQTFTGAVPLVAGRDGVLRVFAVASEANALKPSVRVRLYVNGGLAATLTATAAAASVPTQVAEGTYAASWNVPIPAAHVRPGLAVLADVDPTGAVAEADESNNAWPRTGTPQALDVRVVPTFAVRFVPIVQSGTGVAGTVGDVATLLKATRAMHPIADVASETRATYTTSRALASGGSGWSEVLSELYSLRVADGSPRDYYGLVRVSYTGGVAGIGYVGAPVSMGWDWSGSASGIMAHEVGHTWGRRHAPCGGVAGADASYPYAGGAIGASGLDVATGTLKSPTTQYDLMGYCNPSWISDYTYRGVLDYRGSSRTALATASFEEEGTAVAQPSLLVWGRVTAAGEVVIEPAFRLVPAPAAEAVAEAAGNGRVRLRWNADAFPMALVRDPATGQVLSFARDGAAEVVSAHGELEIVLSDRVQSVGQRVRVRGR